MSGQDRVYFNPPECVADCDDPMCPYPHRGSWHVKGVPLAAFDTREEAEAYDRDGSCYLPEETFGLGLPPLREKSKESS